MTWSGVNSLPVYEKFLGLLFKLEDIDDKVEFTFNSLLIDKHNKDNMEGMKSYIDLLSQMLGDGVLTVQQYAKAAQMYATDGIVDFGLTDEAISELKDKVEEEMEDIKI